MSADSLMVEAYFYCWFIFLNCGIYRLSEQTGFFSSPVSKGNRDSEVVDQIKHEQHKVRPLFKCLFKWDLQKNVSKKETNDPKKWQSKCSLSFCHAVHSPLELSFALTLCVKCPPSGSNIWPFCCALISLFSQTQSAHGYHPCILGTRSIRCPSSRI